MPKTRKEKEESVQQLADNIDTAKAAIFASFSELTVHDIEELRAQCREAKVSCSVVKKTLLVRALKEKKLDGESVLEWEGNILVGFGAEDEVAAAKTFATFAKKHEQLQLRAGILEAAFVDQAVVAQLATLPSREELLAKVVGSCQAPVSGFVQVLSGNLRNLVGVLSAIQDTKTA